MSECGLGSRIVGPFEQWQAAEVAHEVVEDKNIVCLIKRFLDGTIEPVEMSGEFQIICETHWTRMYGEKERKDIHDLRN